MSGVFNSRVIVAGAGVFGAVASLVLARAGAQVTLIDPRNVGDNASGVAAGMLAPAFEALLDPLASDHFTLLRHARDQWPAFADSLGVDIGLHRSGGLWVEPESPNMATQLDGRLRALRAIGAQAETVAAADMRGLAPDLSGRWGGGVFTAEDWRLDVPAALKAILAAGLSAGVEPMRARLVQVEQGVCTLDDGRRLKADWVVLAMGAEAARCALAPELAVLSPIKGHILRSSTPGLAKAGAPAVRCAGGYGWAGPTGVVVGATMQPGRADLELEAERVAELQTLAVGLFPDLVDAIFRPATGVRAGTPDGLPLVGPSSTPGVLLAVGARRNGWLLAPLVADMIAAYATGVDPGAWASRLIPGRFAAG